MATKEPTPDRHGRSTFFSARGRLGPVNRRVSRHTMITLYGIGDIFEGGHGETKDLRVQWALEEVGLDYRFHALDQTAGDLDSESYARISPFHQVPVIDDDGFILAESAAILLYIAEKANRLIPSDVQGRTTVTQWCFAAVSTVAPTLQCIETIEIFDEDKTATKVLAETRKLAARWFRGVERRLEGREWLARDEFTVADIAMASVLRTIRKTDLMAPFPGIESYYERCHARPAWQRTLKLAAERLGKSVDQLR
jgi:glutathione S-transferase